MKNQFIIPSIIIAAAIVGGFWTLKPPVKIIQAVKDGNVEEVKKYLAAGMDVNAKALSGETPLYIAIARADNEITKLLISKGADVNAVDDGGFTPLDHATCPTYQNSELADLLRKHGGKYGTIHGAAGGGGVEAVKEFLAAGIDVNAKDWDGKTPLDYAITTEHLKTADLLRKHGGKSGAEDSIRIASMFGNIEAIKKHLDSGADVNVKNAEGRTPLHYAVYKGHKEIAELLIANGADVNAKTASIRDTTTPLHWAVGGGHKEIAELLIANDADVNAQSENGSTPLDWAILENQSKLADLFRKHGGKTGEELKAATKPNVSQEQ